MAEDRSKQLVALASKDGSQDPHFHRQATSTAAALNAATNTLLKDAEKLDAAEDIISAAKNVGMLATTAIIAAKAAAPYSSNSSLHSRLTTLAKGVAVATKGLLDAVKVRNVL